MATLFVAIFSKKAEGSRRNSLITLCTTRWLERVDSLNSLFEMSAYVLDALHDIADGNFSGDASTH